MNLDFYAILTLVIVGGIAGFLASLFMRGGGLGVVGNVIVGLVGAVIAGYLFKQFPGPLIGLHHYGILLQIGQGFVGAVILLFVLGLLKGKR